MSAARKSTGVSISISNSIPYEPGGGLADIQGTVIYKEKRQTKAATADEKAPDTIVKESYFETETYEPVIIHP